MSNKFILAKTFGPPIRCVVKNDGVHIERDLNQMQTETLGKISFAQLDKLMEWRKEVAP